MTTVEDMKGQVRQLVEPPESLLYPRRSRRHVKPKLSTPFLPFELVIAVAADTGLYDCRI